MAAMSAMCHRGWFPARMPTRSPGWTPTATRPAAASRTASPYSRQVISRQVPSTTWRSAVRSDQRETRSKNRSTSVPPTSSGGAASTVVGGRWGDWIAIGAPWVVMSPQLRRYGLGARTRPRPGVAPDTPHPVRLDVVGEERRHQLASAAHPDLAQGGPHVVAHGVGRDGEGGGDLGGAGAPGDEHRHLPLTGGELVGVGD